MQATVGILFPGYGNQFVGMGKEFYDQERRVQEYFEEAGTCLGMNFVRLCFASSDAELSRPVNAYPSLWLVRATIYGLIRDLGITPVCVAGEGVGYYNALHAARSITTPDAVYLLGKWSVLFQEFIEHSVWTPVLIRGLDERIINRLCRAQTKKNIFIGGYYPAGQNTWIVLATEQGYEAIQQYSREYSARGLKLAKGWGFPSVILKDVTKAFTHYLPKVDIKPLTVPVLNPLTGEFISNAELARDLLIKQLMGPVRWDLMLEKFSVCNTIIEIGPSSIIGEITRALYPNATVISIQTPGDLGRVRAHLGIVQK